MIAPSVRVLGCSGSIAKGNRTTAFLLDNDILIDAGTGVGDLTLEEMSQIDHIVLSHSHLDHVLGIPLLADSVMRRRRGRPPIRVLALEATLDVLRRHLFNDQLWPDFTKLPQPDAPVLELVPVRLGDVLNLGQQQRKLEVLPALHSVPAIGTAVEGLRGWWVYTGDTGPNPMLWECLRGRALSHLTIEVAFPESEHALAGASLHHCPSTLASELRHLPPGVHVQLTHVKPGDMTAVRSDLAKRLPDTVLHALRAGQRFLID
jgi:cAMP phosphodiesterase